MQISEQQRYWAAEGGRGNGSAEYIHLLDPNRERDPLHVEWDEAPAEFAPFLAGSVNLPNGISYTYPGGDILRVTRVVDGKTVHEPVMSTAEYNWSTQTVNAAMNYIERQARIPGDEPIRVLEFGVGRRLMAARFIDRLKAHGVNGRGEYHGVELNKFVFDEAEKWRKRKLIELGKSEKDVPGSQPDIKIHLYHGEAGEWANELLKQVQTGQMKKFHIIVSDTYPLVEEERGMNDLQHLPTLIQLLEREGCFAFFPYVPKTSQSDQEISFRQYKAVNTFFSETISGHAAVFPPPQYEYLWTERNGERIPIQSLPVLVAINPIIPIFSSQALPAAA